MPSSPGSWPRVPESRRGMRTREAQIKGDAHQHGASLHYGPGALDPLDLVRFREQYTEQQVAFTIGADLAREYIATGRCDLLAHALFPQLLAIVDEYLQNRCGSRRTPTCAISCFRLVRLG